MHGEAKVKALEQCQTHLAKPSNHDSPTPLSVMGNPDYRDVASLRPLYFSSRCTTRFRHLLQHTCTKHMPAAMHAHLPSTQNQLAPHTLLPPHCSNYKVTMSTRLEQSIPGGRSCNTYSLLDDSKTMEQGTSCFSFASPSDTVE